MRELAIAIPSNILEDCQSLSEKTHKLGIIARAASIFKVTKIHVYRNQGRSDKELIILLLRYLVTPQYLRKNIFPIKQELKLAGTLPPLRIPSHTVNRQYNPNIVEIRDGVCVQFDKKSKISIIDLGLKRHGVLRDNIPIGDLVTVKIISESYEGKYNNYFLLQKSKPKDYWGYDISYNKSLNDVFTSNNYDIKVITSKFGSDLNYNIELISKDIEKNPNSSILIAFGSPKIGLMSVLSREKINKSNLFIVNLFPNQGVETIRSEEAIMAGLSIFNSLNSN